MGLKNGHYQTAAGSEMWIVAANAPSGKRVYLADYAGQSKHDVQRKVANAAYCEGYRGSLSDRLTMLWWEIIPIRIEESVPNA